MIKWLEKNYIISKVLAILIMLFIFYLSSIPGSGFPSGLGISTKIYHLGIFFVLSFFLSISIIKGKNQNKDLVYLAAIICIFYALTDELHQLFVPGRTSAVTDVLIDSIGILIANITYITFLRIRWFKQHQTIF